MVPNGWKKDIIGNHIDLLSGFPFKSKEYTDDPDSIRLLRGDNVAQGYIRWTGCKRWENSNGLDVDRFALEPFDLVIAMDRTWVSSGLKISEIKEEDTPSLLVQRVSRLRANGNFVQGLLKQVFNSYRFEQYVKGVQTETAVPHISAQQIKEYPIFLPPLPEQKKIARILSTWDKAIETVDKLIENSQQQKKALMQQLLTGKKRLPGFSGEWKEFRLGDLIKLASGKTKPKDTTTLLDDGVPVYGGNGILGYSDSHNVEGKTIVVGRVGEYCGVTRLVSGRIWVTDNALYTKAIDPNVDAGFLTKKIQSYDLSRLRNKGGQPLISQKPIYSVKTVLPDLSEQKGITRVLTNCDNIIANQQSLREKYYTQKQALMQQLLTGIRRVEV